MILYFLCWLKFILKLMCSIVAISETSFLNLNKPSVHVYHTNPKSSPNKREKTFILVKNCVVSHEYHVFTE